jgi:uncharacterized membrane protein
MFTLLQTNSLVGVPFGLLLAVSALLGGLMAGFFSAFSVSVVLALQTLSAPAYTTMLQEINEKVLNVSFGVVFVGAAVVSLGGAAVVLFQGHWQTLSGQLYLAGMVVSLTGAFLVTAGVHIPTNERIATWSPVSPPDEWATVRTHWTRWNHVRTTAATVAFVLYLAAMVSFGS